MTLEETGLTQEQLDRLAANPLLMLCAWPEAAKKVCERCDPEPPLELIATQILAEVREVIEYVEGFMELDSRNGLYVSRGPTMGYFDRTLELACSAFALLLLRCTAITDRVTIPHPDGTESYWLPPGPQRDLTDLLMHLFTLLPPDYDDGVFTLRRSVVDFLKRFEAPFTKAIERLEPGIGLECLDEGKEAPTDLITLSDAEARFERSRSTFEKWIKRGDLVSQREGDRGQHLVSLTELTRVAASKGVKARG